ncbi:putative Radial spoke head 1-like protein [Hypsibius exemplaris]|uniref:Radial spoke head 1-like protein n=1 Tax=Hypsibius exemplaris TaxID=2072580 RepID=A0A1W0WAY5_HYPEX|nr:putative Radial spoke head 1-like protein [Hypsibius exemplaris]
MLDDTTDEDEEEVAFVGEYNGERNERKQRHGQGITILPNGDRYKGQYVRNLRDGQGLYVFKGGARYEGAWRFGRKHGKGKFTYPDGSIYEGNWVNDKRYGYGIYHYQNGDMYLGQWKYGERSGYGYYLFKDSQAKYVGYWENGRRQGRGRSSSGRTNTRVFQSDSPVGPGRFIFLGGWEQQGHFIPFRAEPHVSSLVQRGQLDDEPDWPADGIPDVATTWIAERTVPSKEPAKHIKMEELMAKFDVTLTLKPPTGGATGSPRRT